MHFLSNVSASTWFQIVGFVLASMGALSPLFGEKKRILAILAAPLILAGLYLIYLANLPENLKANIRFLETNSIGSGPVKIDFTFVNGGKSGVRISEIAIFELATLDESNNPSQQINLCSKEDLEPSFEDIRPSFRTRPL
jgi:hypothetical protein